MRSGADRGEQEVRSRRIPGDGVNAAQVHVAQVEQRVWVPLGSQPPQDLRTSAQPDPRR